jgi:hypothetical protein
VRVFVGDDPRRHRTHDRVGSVGSQAAVIRERHHLGDRQYHQLGPQAHQPAQAHEDRIRPVLAHWFAAEIAKQAQQQRRMLLFFADEKPCSIKVFGISGLGGLAQ